MGVTSTWWSSFNKLPGTESVDGIVNLLLKPVDAALLALHMLHEPAQRLELLLAPVPHRRAPIELVLVHGALDVLVERVELAERLVAQVALVRGAVPRPLRCPRGHLWARVVFEEARGVGEDAVTVETRDESVDRSAIHMRLTPSRFKVRNEGCAGDERAEAAFHGAVDREILVEFGTFMSPKVGVSIEHPIAGEAVKIGMSLLAMIAEPSLAFEELVMQVGRL